MEEKQPFRFLSDAEFFRLSARERAIYLVRASQELEIRQWELREQMKANSNPEDKT